MFQCRTWATNLHIHLMFVIYIYIYIYIYTHIETSVHCIQHLPSSPYVQCVFDDNTAQQILSVTAKAGFNKTFLKIKGAMPMPKITITQQTVKLCSLIF